MADTELPLLTQIEWGQDSTVVAADWITDRVVTPVA